MHNRPDPTDDSRENDLLWQLLGNASSRPANPRFLDDTVRAARLLAAPAPWWKCLVAPLPLTACAAATALAICGFLAFFPSSPFHPATPSLTTQNPETEEIADLAELADSETLVAAVDYLDSFSDTELITLIGL